jgi:DNA-binding beta-propeller fold protein YncE
VNRPSGLAYDASSSQLFISNERGDNMLKYDFVNSALSVIQSSTILDAPHDMTLGPTNDASLYVTSSADDEIILFSILTGNILNQFSSASLDGPMGITMGPNFEN